MSQETPATPTLFTALTRRNLPALQNLLRLKADPNILDEFDQSPLFLASEQNQIAMVKALLAAKAEPNIRNKNNDTALHKAGSFSVALLLLKAGSNPDLSNSNNQKPCDKARAQNQTMLVDLYKEWSNKQRQAALALLTGLHDRVGSRSSLGQAWKRNKDIADKNALRRIFKFNEAETIATLEKNAALLKAAVSGKLDAVQTLLTTGAQVNARRDPPNAGYHYVFTGCTALHLASYHGYNEIVRVLLAAKADPQIKDYDEQETPLSHAASTGHVQVVTTLLAAVTTDHLGEQSRHGETALHKACRFNHLPVVKKLLAARADLTIVNNVEQTPRDIAFEEGHTALIALIDQELEQRKTESLADSGSQPTVDFGSLAPASRFSFTQPPRDAKYARQLLAADDGSVLGLDEEEEYLPSSKSNLT